MQVYDEREDYEPALQFFRACNVKGHAKVARWTVRLAIAGCILLVAILGWPA